jgi:5-methyltetrahydrofolate--homocysteine methyltransferase
MSLETIYEAVLTGDNKKADAEVSATLQANTSAEDVLYKACIPAMEEVGRLFEQGEKFVPDLLISARAMQTVMSRLKPLLAQADIKSAGKVVIGTVGGDLHDIGKNLVGTMLEGSGFEVVDLGTDVAPEKFVDAVRDLQPEVVGLSALLTTTMPSMTATIKALGEAGLREKVKVLIGGAPVTQDFADSIGADGFAPDASSAARKTKEMLGVS